MSVLKKMSVMVALVTCGSVSCAPGDQEGKLLKIVQETSEPSAPTYRPLRREIDMCGTVMRLAGFSLRSVLSTVGEKVPVLPEKKNSSSEQAVPQGNDR